MESKKADEQAAAGSTWQHEYPADLQDAERQLVDARRKVNGIALESPGVGFALSGGGIRSATFCLGIFQALAARRLIRRIDYLSTVSGGGYFGSFLGALLAREGSTVQQTEALLTPNADMRGKPIKPLRWLRENSRYLAPNGSGDLLSAFATLLRNWASVMLVVFTFVLMLFLGLQLLQLAADACCAIGAPSLPATQLSASGAGALSWSALVNVPVALFVLVVVPLGWAYWLVGRPRPDLNELHPILGVFLALGVAAVGGLAIHWGWLKPLPGLEAFFWTVVVLGGLALVFWAHAIALAARATVEALSRLEPEVYTPDNATSAASKDDGDRATLLLAEFVAAAAAAGMSAAFGAPFAGTILAVALLLVCFARYLSCWLEFNDTYQRFLQAARARDAGEPVRRYHHDEMRNDLTDWLALSLSVTLLLGALALIDTLGQSFYRAWLTDDADRWLGLSGLLTAAAPLLFNIERLGALFKADDSSRLKLPLQVVAGVIATLAALAVLVAADALSHAFIWGFAKPGNGPYDWRLTAAAFGTALAASWLFARTWPFLNRSAQHHLYAARLTRAYLGASNPARFGADPTGVTLPIPGDDLADGDYWDADLVSHGGPLHFINVTVNQTATTTDRTVNRDRNGIGLAVGPAGLSAGVRHHALLLAPEEAAEESASAGVDVARGLLRRLLAGATSWVVAARQSALRALLVENGRRDILPLVPPGDDMNMFGTASRKKVESLSLGQWTAISGAAFSTGLGSRTTMAMALLAGFANVRLGYWWNSGSDAYVRERRRRLTRRISRRLGAWFRVQRYLYDEFTATFYGPDEPHWYLSDGGHFENMGAYELVRRRVPIMVVVDGEEDSAYTYEGLANLVRKARLDFRAEITFLDDAAAKARGLQRLSNVLGSLDALRPDLRAARSEDRFSNARAALALVEYPPDPGTGTRPKSSVLLYIKPTLRVGDSVDVRHYKALRSDFPQESTLDQFFDEAQWESYRRLGERIGSQVFGDVARADAPRPDAIDAETFFAALLAVRE